MELFTYYRSSAAYRVRIALNLKSIACTLTPVNLLTGEHREDAYGKVNPQCLVPTLRLDDGRTLTQSGAILDYLEDNYPATPLYPDDSFARANVKSLCQVISCDIHPINNLRVLKYISDELNVDDLEKTTWYQHWIRLGFETLEASLTATPYALGDTVGMVDVYLIPQVYNALRFKLDMDAFPKIMAVYRACNELEAFKQAAPEAQDDCVS